MRNKFILIEPKSTSLLQININHILLGFKESYQHPYCVFFLIIAFCVYLVQFSIPLHHLLVYNYYVIRDIPLYILKCKVHLHSLLFVCENFRVALKMYFLCSVRFPLSADTMPNITALQYLLSVSVDNDSSLRYCSCCSYAGYHRFHFSGY